MQRTQLLKAHSKPLMGHASQVCLLSAISTSGLHNAALRAKSVRPLFWLVYHCTSRYVHRWLCILLCVLTLHGMGEVQATEDRDEEEEAEQAALEERDPETFDDGEFYQQMLKEFLEGSGADAAAVSASAQVHIGSQTGGFNRNVYGESTRGPFIVCPQLCAVHAHPSWHCCVSRCEEGPKSCGKRALQGGRKKRKNVDRRASKGRKLRYQVMEKLVHFMAPVQQAEPPALAAQLFANLFGQSRATAASS